jgi:hypothetical protein
MSGLGDCAIKGDKLLGSRVAAGLQTLHFAEPAVESGFCNAVLEVVNDLDQASMRDAKWSRL